MDLGLGLLLSAIAAPAVSSIFGGNTQTAPFKGWMSPSLGMQDPYLLNAMYKRGLQYGIGDPRMFQDIMRAVRGDWPNIMAQYKPGTAKKSLHERFDEHFG